MSFSVSGILVPIAQRVPNTSSKPCHNKHKSNMNTPLPSERPLIPPSATSAVQHCNHLLGDTRLGHLPPFVVPSCRLRPRSLRNPSLLALGKYEHTPISRCLGLLALQQTRPQAVKMTPCGWLGPFRRWVVLLRSCLLSIKTLACISTDPSSR